MTLIEVEECPNGLPSLMSFPGGLPSKADEFRVSVGRKGSGRKCKHILTCESNDSRKIVLKGYDYGSQSCKKDTVQYAVGVYDKSSDTLTLIPSSHVFTMRPTINKGDSMMESSPGMANYDRKRGLVDAFGTDKKKRAVKANEAKRVDGTKVVGLSAVQRSITTEIEASQQASQESNNLGHGEDGAAIALSAQRERLLPKFDQDALQTRKIYNLDGIMPPRTRELLEKWHDKIAKDLVKKISEGDGGMVDAWNTAFGEMSDAVVIPSLSMGLSISSRESDADDTTKREKKLRHKRCSLIFLAATINMYLGISGSSSLRRIDLVKLKALLQKAVTPNLCDIIINTFGNLSSQGNVKSGKEGYHHSDTAYIHFTKEQVDRLLLHIIVLVLVLNRYTFEIDVLASSLGLSIKRTTLLAREAGCTISKVDVESDDGKTKKTSIATLKAPLTFPKPSRGQQNK
jgi:hypothetical protein